MIGACGLIYELIAGTVASYVLGDSVTQFSTVIGVYLFAMGIGAWASSFIRHDVAARFVEVEISVALLGGGSAAILFLAFARAAWFQGILYGLVLAIGILVGIEIPLLMRLLKDRYELKDLVSRVLTFDYLGALVASLVFPLFLVPKLGLIRGSFAIGLVNAIVGLWCTHLLRDAFLKPRTVWFLRVEGGLTILVLGAGLVSSDHLTSLSEERMYADPIVYAERTPYQRIVVTHGQSGFHLYLDGNLQFTSHDEHRYHEALVHPAVAGRERWAKSSIRSALVLGGGDGLAVREILKYSTVERVVLVDLDPAITELASRHPLFTQQNEGSLSDRRVSIVNADAMVWLDGRTRDDKEDSGFDLVVVDFPDPNTFALGKLYTSRFYRLLTSAVARHGVVAVQATSPLYARRSFWCVRDTMMAAGWSTRAYHVSVPSFGEWGFLLAARSPIPVPDGLAASLGEATDLRYLNDPSLRAAFVFPRDMASEKVGVNRLDNQILVQIYREEWALWQ